MGAGIRRRPDHGHPIARLPPAVDGLPVAGQAGPAGAEDDLTSLLSVLRNRGYIEKEEESGRYRLGPGFVELASLFLNSIEFKTEAEPHLRRLSQITGQTVFLATLQGTGRVWLQSLPFSRLAARILQHAPTAGGRAGDEGSVVRGLTTLMGK